MVYVFGSQQYLEDLLKEYKKLKRAQKKEFSLLPQGYLSRRMVKNKVNYVQIIGRQRYGITKNEELIKKLARKKFLQCSLERLDKNIAFLEHYLMEHQSVAPEDIIGKMPPAYKGVSLSAFLPEKDAADAWEKTAFDQSTYNPEERNHTTSTGLKVRSKSEVIIADRLDFHKVPFRYEQMLHIENQAFSPDFTIQRRGKLIYWEHCGLMNNKKYRNHHKWKLSMYEKAGIVPWDNLIVTYDDENGKLDVRIIDSEIQNKLKA